MCDALSFDVKRFFTFILQVIPRQMLCKNVEEILKEVFFPLTLIEKQKKYQNEERFKSDVGLSAVSVEESFSYQFEESFNQCSGGVFKLS